MQTRPTPLVLALTLFAAACATQDAHQQLHSLLDEDWEFRLKASFKKLILFWPRDFALPPVICLAVRLAKIPTCNWKACWVN